MKQVTKLGLLAIMMLIAVVLLTGCGNGFSPKQNAEKEDSLEGLAVYTAEEVPGYVAFTEITGVEFKYPSNYVSIGNEDMPVFMDPDVAGATINLVTSDFPEVLSFEGYVDASIPGLKEEMQINGDIKKEYINLNGRKAARLDYVAESEGNVLAVTQVLIKKENKAFILTLGSLEKDKATVQDKFETIIKSFQ